MKTNKSRWIFLLLLVGMLSTGCNTDENTYVADGLPIDITETLPADAYAAEVGNITITPAVHQITVNWVEPAEQGTLSHYLVEWKGSASDAAPYSRTVKKGTNSIVLDRIFNEEYAITVKCVAADLRVSAGVPVTGTSIHDVTPPGTVSGFSAAPLSKASSLSWGNPTDADFEMLELKVIHTAVDTAVLTTVLLPSATSYMVAGLQTTTDYHATIAARDYLGNGTEVTLDFKTRPEEKIIDKTKWKIVDFSTEETSGDPGQAANAIDGNNTTFWHSRWTGDGSSLPQYIVIDLGETITPSTLVSYKRSGNTNGPTLIKVEGSTDQTTWNDFGTHTVKRDVDTGQDCYLTNAMPSHFIRVTVLAAGGAFAMIREIDIMVPSSE